MSMRLIEEKELKVSNDDIRKLINKITDLEIKMENEIECLNTIVWGKRLDEDDEDSERDCFDEDSIDRRLDILENTKSNDDGCSCGYELKRLRMELYQKQLVTSQF